MRLNLSSTCCQSSSGISASHCRNKCGSGTMTRNPPEERDCVTDIRVLDGVVGSEDLFAPEDE